MKVWYTVGDPFAPRIELDLGETPYCLSRKREAGEVIEVCAKDFHYKHRDRVEGRDWPQRVTLFDGLEGRAICSMDVDMEFLPDFTAYTHTEKRYG